MRPARDVGMSDENRVVVFGPDPETNNASDHAGALTVSDARLVLLPIRSLTGHFKWATCPALLRRLDRDLRRLGLSSAGFEIPGAEKDRALAHAGAKDDTHLFLEEFRLEVKGCDLKSVIAVLAELVPGGDATGLLEKQLVVVEDDLFSHLARYAVPVAAHVCISKDTKTVKEGALWYEESLPPETVLYVALTAWRARKKDVDLGSAQILEICLDGLFKEHPYLQLGGNETVGMGWCQVGTSVRSAT